jgi:hypothetical protein
MAAPAEYTIANLNALWVLVRNNPHPQHMHRYHG